MKAIVIGKDKNGRKIYLDSILRDVTANEYFIPVRRGNTWGDEFLDDFYAIDSQKTELIKRHGNIEELKKMMRKSKDQGAIWNVSSEVYKKE